MPELPEVETIRLGLQNKIVGLKIKEVEVLAPKSFIGAVGVVRGKSVLNLWRKAKILGIDLSGNIIILVHLKMSGQLIWLASQKSKVKNGERFIGGHPTQDMVLEMPNRSTRVIFTFSDNSKLFFNDQRRFGWVKVVESGKLGEVGIFGRLGPEPLEQGFTWMILKQNLLKHKTLPIKVALLDQTVVSGIGNIYASEACFVAKIDPRAKVVNLTDKHFQALHRGVVRVLRDGIKYGGSSSVHFVDPEGRKGYFLNYAYCYGRDKHACKVCKTEIKKVQLGGRGTYFCPNCQS